MNGELVVVDDVSPAFTERVAAAFSARANDDFSFALSGGSTARACYEHLADNTGSQIDWWKVDFYWGDERCVPLQSQDSNYRLAREALLDRVGAANATYPMRCEEGADPYQLRIGELGKLDLVHLGLGPDGHTASLFPRSAALDADPGRLVVMNEDPLHNNKLRFLKLGKMAAYCGKAKTSLLGKLGHRECWAGDQRHQHVGARRIADQSGDARDVRAFLHSLIQTELSR